MDYTMQGDDEGPNIKKIKSEASAGSQTEVNNAAAVERSAAIQADQAQPVSESLNAARPGLYTHREQCLIKQENEGNISFQYVLNDGTPENMVFLIGLKNIFSKQLPNMPKEYICRLVLDRRHRSVALLNKDRSVVGGITYRPFHAHGFGEIAFCAVTANEQVKGFGTRLMNYTKEYARTKDQLTHFLTYADNNAVGYFIKQGFTKEITLDRSKWVGFIKDYDGGTLMECVMHPKICYIAFPDIIRAQKDALDAKVRTLSNYHIIYPGLTHWQTNEGPMPVERIPGVKEAGWQPPTGPPPFQLLVKGGRVDPTPENLHTFCTQLLHVVKENADAWPFLEPVSVEDVPDYYDIIKDPIDLQTVEARLRSRKYYVTLDMFLADLKRMMANCRVYNAVDTQYYKIADKLEQFFEKWVEERIVYLD